MSDKAPGTDHAPGSGAGDAAHTASIPRIEREAETDKGRPRSSPKSSPKSGSKSGTKSVSKPGGSGPKKPAPSDGGPAGRPLTASDYARTTSQSPSSTAVIPAVKAEREATPVPKTVAPSKKQGSQDSAPGSMQMSDSRGGRAATLRLSYVEPWSVTRMAFAISVAMMIVAVVAVAIFWVVLDVSGVWNQIDGSVTSVLSDDSSTFRITDYLGFGRLVGLSLVLSAMNVVIMTVLATIAAHLYNLAAQLLGGFEVTYTSQD